MRPLIKRIGDIKGHGCSMDVMFAFVIVASIHNTTAIYLYSEDSISSTTRTLMLPLQMSAQRCSASWAFSNGKTCVISFFKSRIPPVRQVMADGQVSR